MSILLAAFILALALIGFAIYKKDYVRASFSLRPFGFFLEAKNNSGKRLPASNRQDAENHVPAPIRGEVQVTSELPIRNNR